METELLDVPPMDDARPVRARLNTSIDNGAFFDQSVRSGVRVPLMARLRALMALSTGQLMKVGYSPLADVKEEAVNANANVGLISALVLTILVPITFDAAYGPQTNGYIITSPSWVGQVYFVACALSSWAFGLSTLIAVLVILVMNETSTMDQARYLKSIADSEFITPLKLFIMGWGFLIVVLVLWASIVLFDLHRAANCDDVSERCGSRPWTFVLMMVGVNLISFLAVNDAALLVAKLYKSRHKLSVALPTGATALQVQEWLVQPSAAIISKQLQTYFQAAGNYATPNGFKEHIVTKSGAGGLSYVADKRIDRLFEEKVSQMVEESHQRLSDSAAAD